MGRYKLRIIEITVINGITEVLATNLDSDEFSLEELIELYKKQAVFFLDDGLALFVTAVRWIWNIANCGRIGTQSAHILKNCLLGLDKTDF